MTDWREFIHVIDAKDRIVSANAEWFEFARENGVEVLGADQILQRPLWDFLHGQETQSIYRALVKKARQAGFIQPIPYRCDAPSIRRFMLMMITSVSGEEVEFRSRIVRMEDRASVNLEYGEFKEKFLTMCGWCKLVFVPDGRWVEVEGAVRELRLFEREVTPKISHGICPKCADQFEQALSN